MPACSWSRAGLVAFEIINYALRTGITTGELFTPFEFWAFATLSFTTVIPAVFGAAELFASFSFLKRLKPGPVIQPTRRVTTGFFLTCLTMLALMWAWPRVFFPFVWLSVYFMMEPVNVWLGNRSLGDWVQLGDWRPILALWIGVLLTGFFWEMWNYFSYPKWIYHVPWATAAMFSRCVVGLRRLLPSVGYAMYHFLAGWLGTGRRYIESC
jgi:hypothetical protein